MMVISCQVYWIILFRLVNKQKIKLIQILNQILFISLKIN